MHGDDKIAGSLVFFLERSRRVLYRERRVCVCRVECTSQGSAISGDDLGNPTGWWTPIVGSLLEQP
ncbi:MAG: hypothetical protein PHF57_10955 [Methanoregula sp.]|nr:hypothetical protein [Methanoregula sp.]